MKESETVTGNDFLREAASVQIVQGKNNDLDSGTHHAEQDEGSESTTKVDDIGYSEVPKEVREYFPPHPDNFEYNLYSSLSFRGYP